MEIYFITSNKGKISSLEKVLASNGLSDIKVISQKLDLVEPQASSVKEVSKSKALQAYSILKKPIL
ncbi:MAG TPA: non-canonical purine NTP pyrophosphatase, partial [Rickettsiales bacterium]|nr:non-canonical purine NTP pyrophosphatase [Rickettsiales bacterium]